MNIIKLSRRAYTSLINGDQEPKYRPAFKSREIKLYMDIAYRVSQMSYAERKKVGALLVRDGRILSMGWNGTPHGWDNICEVDNVTKPEVLHAELNSLSKIAKSHDTSNGSTLFVTMSPCPECAKLIIQSGVIQVIYHEKYRLTDGIDMLEKSNINVIRLENYAPPGT